MIEPASITAISYYLTRTIAALPKVKQSISSFFSENQNTDNSNTTSNLTGKFKKAQAQYYQEKLKLDKRLFSLEKQKQSFKNKNHRERLELKQIELELKAEISAKRFELLRTFQRENIDLKWAEIKIDWDSKGNWFSKINRVDTEQILNKYADCLLILTSLPKIAKDSSVSIFQDLDFELQMRNLEDFLENRYPSKNVSHPVKHFSNYFKEPIGKIEVDQLHSIFNRISTYVIYPDITEKEVTFRVAYWYINGQLEFFSDPFKWNWKETQNQLLVEGQTKEQSISTIRDMFVSFHKILTAFWIDYYYLSIDPFYDLRISSLENDLELKESIFQKQVHTAFETLKESRYSQYLSNLQISEDNMSNTDVNQQAAQILKNLQIIFSDRPEILRLLDPSNLDPDRIAGEVILDSYKNQEGFASTVNFYATGRTRAGKTSLGNTLLAGNMKSTGNTDCTDYIGYFRCANNLQYFDLPGAGSKEDYENINRKALLLEPIQMRRRKKGNSIEDKSLEVRDYTSSKHEEDFKREFIPVETWQSDEIQLISGSDVILYVIAPHEGTGRDDENYLYDLLCEEKEKRGSCNVIFALNLHLTKSGEPKYTKANVDDVRKMIADIYNEVFSDSSNPPAIIEINSLTGEGADKIAEEICKLLPVDKLGKMEEVLGEKLKEKARKERSKKFRKALIYIASRLATYKVDRSFDAKSDIVAGAYGAVYSYSLAVFQQQNINSQNVYGVIGNVAEQTKKKATKEKTVKEPIIETIEKFRTEFTPKFGEIETEEEVIINDPVKEKTTRTEEIPGTWYRKKRTKTITEEKIVNKQRVVSVKKTSYGQIGTESRTVPDGHHETVTRYEEKVVALEYLRGGYDLILGILSIGLGVEKHPDGNIDSFPSIYANGQKEANSKIEKLKPKIEKIINNSDSQKAENQIIKILSEVLL